jgi:hypothetical protein
VTLRLVLFVLALTACGSDPAEPRSSPSGPPLHTLDGTLKAPECGGGYDIIDASVTLRDGEGNIVGSDTTALVEKKTGFAGLTVRCIAGFTISDVPERDFYEITIGTHGGPSYSLSEMEEMDWTLDLSLD